MRSRRTATVSSVMGVGMLSVIVMITLIASAIASTRGVNEAIGDL